MDTTCSQERSVEDEMVWALGDDMGGLFVWDLADPAVPATLSFPGMKYGAGTMALSRDSATLASAHEDVELWSVKERTWIRKLPFSGLTDMEKGSNAISFSPNGTWLAAGSFQSGVWIWDTQRWQNRILYLRDIICTADFSPDGDRFVASDVSGMVKLWDVATWQPVAAYHGSVVDFSPDGTILAVGCDDHFASHWMPQAGRVRLHHAPSLAEIDAGRAKAARSSDDLHSEH